MKLSPTQQNIIDKMNEGWELKSGSGPDSRSWLSRVRNNKLETLTVSGASLYRLYKLGLLTYERSFPISRWNLVNR